MKPTELRIGNLILGEYYNHNDEEREDEKYGLCKVVGINAAGFSEYNIWVEGLDETGIEEYERFEGVRITEEWLLRFGFEGDNMDMWKVLPTGNQLELHIDCVWEGKFENACLTQGRTGEGVPGKDYKFAYLSDVKYIHQLQNLYFALTGKELELK